MGGLLRVGLRWGLGILLMGALAQQVLYPPSFGPYEDLRRQAHAQCQGHLAQGAQAYISCLQRLAVSMCMGPYAPPTDPMSGMACTAAVSAGYPAPGKPVLTRPHYRVEVAGGVERERDVRTGQVIRQKSIPPHLLYTLERTPQGTYRGTRYDPQGQPLFVYPVSPACELLDQGGRPAMDGWACPVYPGKPYLHQLIPSPLAGMPPNAQFYTPGRLADDFDGDGVVEMGYMATGGTGGRTYTSGWARAVGYDPNTHLLKFQYEMAARESESAYTSYVIERLALFRVR
ncbi:MAG: hypothetical protein ACK4G4_00630 [Thermus sp.]|uniref:hypothetical protein n=1 Tax=Thermus sp. TaxID=275 RepID=UPI003918E870